VFWSRIWDVSLLFTWIKVKYLLLLSYNISSFRKCAMMELSKSQCLLNFVIWSNKSVHKRTYLLKDKLNCKIKANVDCYTYLNWFRTYQRIWIILSKCIDYKCLVSRHSFKFRKLPPPKCMQYNIAFFQSRRDSYVEIQKTKQDVFTSLHFK
jgi:hypothetical protein